MEEFSIGRVRVLLVRMNSDLAMGDVLLKKTGSGNLFTVFGEPDMDDHARGRRRHRRDQGRGRLQPDHRGDPVHRGPARSRCG